MSNYELVKKSDLINLQCLFDSNPSDKKDIIYFYISVENCFEEIYDYRMNHYVLKTSEEVDNIIEISKIIKNSYNISCGLILTNMDYFNNYSKHEWNESFLTEGEKDHYL